MTMTESGVLLADISQELKSLWNAELGEKKIRASLFTLILYAQKTERKPFYDNLIKSVLSKFPCRVIFIVEDIKQDEKYLKTKVSTEAIGKGTSQIYCEIIQVEAAGALVERVPFIILPHILPDLPVYLLWAQDPAAENTVLPHLEPLANRIIFDSESTSDLQHYSQAVLDLIKRFHCAIGDLHWSAISGWRQAFAQVFDNQDSFLSLVQTKTMRITYNQLDRDLHRHPELEACYLQAWIASRVNWKIQTIDKMEGNIRLTYHRPMDELVILLIPQEQKTLPQGSILSVEIESAKNKGQYTLKRHPESRRVFVQYADKERCDLPCHYFLPGHQEGQEIVEEIFYPSGTKHYQDMLEVLSMKPWSLQ